jgi:hypothetical protein
VTAAELLAFLIDFYRDKLAIRQRHVAAARFVSNYDFNNTYQYIIAREDLQLNWLRDALTDLGGSPPEVSEPEIRPNGKGDAAQLSVIGDDRNGAQAFFDKWESRVESLSHARHRIMLRVILGETREHKRFFEQALAGRTDLLGRRADGAGTGGGVMATRWVE